MPARGRGGSTDTQLDRSLADWLTAADRPVSPTRVAGWRRAGLLPMPSGRVHRRGPGRTALTWTESELADARVIGLGLAHATGRGKSSTTAVMRLAAEGLPIPPLAVLAAAREHLMQLDRDVRTQLGIRGRRIDANTDPEGAADVVDGVLRAHPSAERAVARRLGTTPPSSGDVDALSVAFLLVGALLGLPPNYADTDVLRLALEALGLQGLVEPVGGPDGPRLLPELAEAGQAIGRFSLADLGQLLADMPPEQVHASLRATRQLGAALRAMPANIAVPLAADKLAALLLDSSPTAVVLRLACWQAIRRDTGADPDIAPIVDAIQAAGWLPGHR